MPVSQGMSWGSSQTSPTFEQIPTQTWTNQTSSIKIYAERMKSPQSSAASWIKFLIMNSSLIKASPTASQCALGKTPTNCHHMSMDWGQSHFPRARGGRRDDNHFSSEFPCLLCTVTVRPGHSLWFSADTRWWFLLPWTGICIQRQRNWHLQCFPEAFSAIPPFHSCCSSSTSLYLPQHIVFSNVMHH